MKTVYFDVDTQLDFMLPSGSLYVPGAESIISHIARMNQQAAAEGSLVISTMDAHAEDDPEFQLWPHHCVKGCLGQRKVASTMLDGAVVVPNVAATLELRGASQLLLEKQTVDCFTNLHLSGILRDLQADKFIVYGVVTEICVLNAVKGLLQLGKPVAIVRDAVQHLDLTKSDAFLKEFRAAGGTLI